MNIEILESCLDADDNVLMAGDYILSLGTRHQVAVCFMQPDNQAAVGYFKEFEQDKTRVSVDGWDFAGNVYKVPPPDTWDKLLEDLDRWASGNGTTCDYTGKRGPNGCSQQDCPFWELSNGLKNTPNCPQLAASDIARRIRELRGGEACIAQ